MTLKGNLEVLNLSDIFQSLSLNQHTGTLRVTDGKREKLIYFAQGEITLLSSDKKLKIGDMLVAANKLSQEDLEYALQQQKKTKKKLGEILVEEGFVTEEDVAEVVRSQIEEEIYDLFLWKKADFEFLIDYCPDKLKNPAHQVTKLQFNTNSLIMEALRRLDEWELISKEIPTLKEVYKVVNTSPAALEDIELPDRIKAEIKLVDGERTVEQIAEETTLSEFELCKLLFELKTRKVIAPLSPQELADRAEEAFEKGKFRQASSLYDRLVEVLPKNISIRWHLADSLKAFGDEVKALDQYEFISKKLEGTRDRAELARCYHAILELAPDRKDIAEKLKLIGKRRTAARVALYVTGVVVSAALIVVAGVRTDQLTKIVDDVKKYLSTTTGGPDIAAEELKAHELKDQADKFESDFNKTKDTSKLRQSFEAKVKIITNYPKTAVVPLLDLPIKIDTIPTGKDVWIDSGAGFAFRDRTPNIFHYIPSSEFTGSKVKIEVREQGRVLKADTVDATTFQDLRYNLFHPIDWAVQVDGAVRARPAFQGTGKDAVAWFPAMDGYLHGVRLSTRESVAKMPLKDNVNVDQFGELVSDAAIAGSQVVLGTLDGNLISYDASQLTRVITTKVSDGPVCVRPAISEDGTLAAIGGNDGSVTLVSIERREKLGALDLVCTNKVTSLVTAGGDVLIGSRDNTVSSKPLGLRRGGWSVEMRGDVVAPPVFSDKYVVAGDRTGKIICVERGRGVVRWEADAGGYVTGLAVMDDMVVAALAGGAVIGFDLQKGSERWRQPVQKNTGRITAADGVVYIASAPAGSGVLAQLSNQPLSGYLYAFDTKTGAERWTAQLPQGARGEPAVFEGRVYVGCEDGNLYGFDVKP